MAGSDNVISINRGLSSLGAELRELRKARDLTLRQLSEVAGISLSHLSAIERGATNPSIDVLNALADGLDVTPSWFFARRSGAGPLEHAFVVRRQNRRDLNILYDEDATALGYQDQLLSSSIGGAFYMGIAEYAPYSETPGDRMQTHNGETHGVILEGELELHIEGEVITLKEGDSYSFDARLRHHARNRADVPCRMIWAVSPVVIPKAAAVRSQAQSDVQQT